MTTQTSMGRPLARSYRHITVNWAALMRVCTVAAFSLCLIVVVLGAYVRLSDAGLGCPDWPGCYGHLSPNAAAAHMGTAGKAVDGVAGWQGRPLELGKAWREMVHRYAAGTLGILIACVAAMALIRWRERGLSPTLALALVAVVMLQGVLGMLTVTWQLQPLIVTLHLLFGFTTLSLLWWLVLKLFPEGTDDMVARPDTRLPGTVPIVARRLALLALVMLAIQISLGGWTSSNYAAIACPDLPTCQGQWWPQADFRAAYVLWHSREVDYEGGVLDLSARIAIDVLHRVGAMAVSLVLLLAVGSALRQRENQRARTIAVVVAALLALQLTIGISMVLRGFPLWLATAHNAGAALLLLALLALDHSLWSRDAGTSQWGLNVVDRILRLQARAGRGEYRQPQVAFWRTKP